MNNARDARTPDGVEIWEAKSLSRGGVEVREGVRPLRVVVVEDYEALMRLYVGTAALLKAASSAAANSGNPSNAVLGANRLDTRHEIGARAHQGSQEV